MSQTFPSSVTERHSAITGATGSGKTITAKDYIEQVVADGHRVCIIDPLKSDYWGLTSSADGKRPGLPFQILGGPRGHIPLHAGAGKAIGEVVASGALPLSILDMHDFGPKEHHKFFVPFMEAVFRCMNGILYLVIDEAHTFAPKERSQGEETMSMFWFKRFATAARAKGVRLVVVTQRTASLHNDILSSCDTTIVHQTTFPADRKAVIKWLTDGMDKKEADIVAGSLSKLRPGEGWFCSRAGHIFDRRQFPMCKTFDNSATPTGEIGSVDVKTAPIDKGALTALIGKAVEEAEASDPKALREKVETLQKKLDEATRAPQVAAPLNIERMVEERTQLLTAVHDAMAEKAKAELSGITAILAAVSERIENAWAVLHPPYSKVTPSSSFERDGPPIAQAITHGQPTLAQTIVREFAGPKGAKAENKAVTPEIKVVAAIAWWNAVGVPKPTRTQVAAKLGYHERTKGFLNAMGAARSANMIEYDNGALVLVAGGKVLGHSASPYIGTLEELHDEILVSVPSGPRQLLNILIREGDKSRAVLAERVGLHERTKSFLNNLGTLRSRGLVEYEGGKVRPAAFLFPEKLLKKRGGAA